MSATLSSIGKQITLYGGITVFIVGVVGDLLNILIFLSLRTFRHSSCAFYLTIISMCNIFVLFFGVFHRFFSALSGIDLTETSFFYCKTRVCFNQAFLGTSMTCWCLATIDQYLATNIRPNWRRFCNIKLAHRIVFMSMVIWMLHGIPYIVFFDHVLVPAANKMTCINTHYILDQYATYFVTFGLLAYVPIVIAALFGSMAYHNVQQMAYRTVPLLRRELEKQLTVMVLLQVVINIFTLLPFITISAVATNKNLMSDTVIQSKVLFLATATLILYYVSYASPFYIYICASERFRRQLIYVLSKIQLHRCYQARTDVNRVAPEI